MKHYSQYKEVFVKLSDTNLRERLMPLSELNLPSDWIEGVQSKKIPEKLDEALRAGKILLDPFPDLSKALGPTTIDVRLGRKLEMSRITLEVTCINHRKVIRRYTFDLRDGEPKLLERTRNVVYLQGGTWIQFYMDEDETLELAPNILITPYTYEFICIPYDLEGELQGRSKLARAGVATHITSPRFDAGWIGCATMEIINQGQANFNLYPGMQMASFSFHQLSSPAETPYWARRTGFQFAGQH